MVNNSEKKIIAHCGLICSDCHVFKKEKCKGCHSDKPMFASCPVKKCNNLKTYKTCADCKEFEDLKKCKKLNSFISKIIGFFTRSNRIRNLYSIRTNGLEKFVEQKKSESINK
jgi:hypothetical protein